MNRQSLAISGGLLVLVVLGFGLYVLFDRDDSDTGAIVEGPGRAAEARRIIADIQQQESAPASVNTIDRPAAAPAADVSEATAAGSEAADGAIAVTPEPTASAPSGAGTELDLAYDQAQQMQAAGQLDDAQLLYFFGARQGHARSAFAYAEMNDPNHHSTATSLLPEPDAFQAFRWYTAARDGGVADAGPRLAALRAWAEDAAVAGNFDAESLLLQWEQ